MKSRIRLKLEAEGCCRACGSARDLTAHHLIPQRWFARRPGVLGRHSPLNIVPLCRHCHRVIDGHLPKLLGVVGLRMLEKRRILRGRLTAAETAFVVGLMGGAWLDLHYPTTTPRHDAAVARTAKRKGKAPGSHSSRHLPGCDGVFCIFGCPVFGERRRSAA